MSSGGLATAESVESCGNFSTGSKRDRPRGRIGGHQRHLELPRRACAGASSRAITGGSSIWIWAPRSSDASTTAVNRSPMRCGERAGLGRVDQLALQAAGAGLGLRHRLGQPGEGVAQRRRRARRRAARARSGRRAAASARSRGRTARPARSARPRGWRAVEERVARRVPSRAAARSGPRRPAACAAAACAAASRSGIGRVHHAQQAEAVREHLLGGAHADQQRDVRVPVLDRQALLPVQPEAARGCGRRARPPAPAGRAASRRAGCARASRSVPRRSSSGIPSRCASA